MAFFSQFWQVFKQLSIYDKLLTPMILLMIIVGVLVSYYQPQVGEQLDKIQLEFINVSLPFFLGLIIMMIPPMCKIPWENFHRLIFDKKYIEPIIISMILNWIVCPLIMFGLSWMVLFDEPEYRQGIIMIGLARCIAMVILWNELAQGDTVLCIILVILNSLLQLVLYAPYQIFFTYVITGDKGQHYIAYKIVALNVVVFLGIPMAVSVILRLGLLKMIGKDAYMVFLNRMLSPWSMIGLLYVILILFIERGKEFLQEIEHGIKCFVPLILYFLITWFGTIFLLRWYYELKTGNLEEEERLLKCGCKEEYDATKRFNFGCGASYTSTITQAFTAASNNFELSLAVSVGIYGSASKQGIAATFGPLIEVPVLVTLTIIARIMKRSLLWKTGDQATGN